MFRLLLILAAALQAEPVRPVPPPGVEVPAADRKDLEAGLQRLHASIEKLKGNPLLPDVRIYHEAARYALQYNEFFKSEEIFKAKELLREGQVRADQLLKGEAPWTTATGLVVRGYRRGGGVIGAAFESRLCLQFLLGRLRDQPAVAVLLGPGRLAEIVGDVLLADAEEAADADDQRLRLAILGNDDVVHVTDLLGVVTGAIVDVLAQDVAGQTAVCLRRDCSVVGRRCGRSRRRLRRDDGRQRHVHPGVAQQTHRALDQDHAAPASALGVGALGSLRKLPNKTALNVGLRRSLFAAR